MNLEQGARELEKELERLGLSDHLVKKKVDEFKSDHVGQETIFSQKWIAWKAQRILEITS
mgnify:CR=1 FL=1